jgi:Zn-dependent protease
MFTESEAAIMTIDTAWPVPFIINPQNLAIDAVVAFCVSVLVTITINAEAQAFVSNILGDHRPGARDRLHFNAFLHLDILGSICYLVGGFGWPRILDIDASKFEYPRLYLVVSRVAGPLANLLLGSIVGSIAMIFIAFDYNPRVFLMVIGVNITTAIYNLIPLPPLAMGYLVGELIPSTQERTRSLLLRAGPFLVLALALLERFSPRPFISPYFDPIIKAIYGYIAGN